MDSVLWSERHSSSGSACVLDGWVIAFDQMSECELLAVIVFCDMRPGACVLDDMTRMITSDMNRQAGGSDCSMSSRNMVSPANSTLQCIKACSRSCVARRKMAYASAPGTFCMSLSSQVLWVLTQPVPLYSACGMLQSWQQTVHTCTELDSY